MKKSRFCLVCLILWCFAVPGRAVTTGVELELNEPATNSDRYVHAKLLSRTQLGVLTTSQGVVNLTPAVLVEDKRPINDWFSNPADANVSLVYRAGRLVKVVIYK